MRKAIAAFSIIVAVSPTALNDAERQKNRHYIAPKSLIYMAATSE
ncbi:MAG: hypothetical protein ACM65M_09965 [Microcoleus sp.]